MASESPEVQVFYIPALENLKLQRVIDEIAQETEVESDLTLPQDEIEFNLQELDSEIVQAIIASIIPSPEKRKFSQVLRDTVKHATSTLMFLY